MRWLHAALLVVASLAATPPAAAAQVPADTSAYERQQSWFSWDKSLHFGISAAGAGLLYAAGREVGLDRWQAAGVSTLLVGAAGVWREVGTSGRFNPRSGEELSWQDLTWNAIGIASGIAVVDLYLRVRERARERGPAPAPAS